MYNQIKRWNKIKKNGDFYIKTYNKANNPINCISCDDILKYSTMKIYPYLVLFFLKNILTI